MRLEISREFLVNRPNNSVRAFLNGGWEIGLRKDIADWCIENKVRYSRIAPMAILSVYTKGFDGIRVYNPLGGMLGPFTIDIHGHRSGILFKLKWL